MTKSFAFESRVPIIKKRIFPQKITDLTIYPYEKMLLLILSSVCPFFSCVGDRTVSETMDRSEILLEANPDSSYTLLNKIETPDRLNERQFARWCMLYCQVADKLYEDMLYTEQLNRALDWYKSHGTAEQRAWIGLYLGRSYVEDKLFHPGNKGIFGSVGFGKGKTFI